MTGQLTPGQADYFATLERYDISPRFRRAIDQVKAAMREENATAAPPPTPRERLIATIHGQPQRIPMSEAEKLADEIFADGFGDVAEVQRESRRSALRHGSTLALGTGGYASRPAAEMRTKIAEALRAEAARQ